MKHQKDIIIVGAGLSGLTLAHLLSKQQISSTILEGSNRIGGRIQTISGKRNTPLELGATWFSEIHPNVIALLEELGVKKYPQFASGKSLFQTKSFEPAQEFEVAESERPSYRVAGGTQTLTDALYHQLDSDVIHRNTKVSSITETEDGLLINTVNEKEFHCGKVVLCLPPQLVGSEIRFTPRLPDHVNVVLNTVQTWMAGSIKFVLEYNSPFWRQNGYSGMLFSHSGIVTEMYDHTNVQEDKYGFTGFLNSGVSSYSPEVRKEQVLKQLESLLGKEALEPLSYHDKIWTDEFILNENQVIHRPHQNNGHEIFEPSYLNGKLFLAGTESSPIYPGYMEGAVLSAKTVFKKLIELEHDNHLTNKV